MRGRRRRLLAAVLLLALALCIGGGAASAADPNARIDLKVLLVSADGTEPTYGLWKSTLDREGVPYDTIVATTAPPLTAAQLADGTTHAKYQAVILATGNLAYFNGTEWGSALSTDEWNVLHDFEAAYGIRQVSAYVYPGPEYGLSYPTSSGDWGGTIGAVTPAGAASFPELVGPVPVENQSWGYETSIANATAFNTLVTGKNGAPMVGVYTHPDDGRQELVVTVDANQYGKQGLLLPHGILRWVTKGVYLGYKRAFFGAQIDDVFLPDARWDTVANTTPNPSPRPIRMRATDVARAALWQAQNKLRLDLVYNAEGANSRDLLTLALLFGKSQFGWVSHTFTHENLDALTQAEITAEIQNNINFARTNRLPNFDAAELVTGEHSGLANPAMPAALAATGVKYIGADNSRQPLQYAIGPALTLPRYPSNVYFNVATRAEQLDEYNYIYLPPALGGGCVASPVTTCLTAPATWEQYVNSEATQMFQHVFANDAKPQYFHQSNLAEDGVFYPVVNELLARYRALMKPALVQVTQKDATLLIQKFDKWRAAVAAGQASGYLQNGQVYIQSSVAIDAPVTGSAAGDVWGGDRSGWQRVSAGQTVAAAATPTVPVAAPSATAIQGTATVGSTLTAPPVANTVATIWVRCNDQGDACGPIRRATGGSYTAAAADAGATLRAIVISRTNGDWAVLRSDASALVAGLAAAPATAAVVNAALPAVEGTAQVARALTADPGVWVGTPAADYRFSWSRCEDGSCVAIDGADDRTYRPGDEDLGSKLKVTVRAAVGDALSEPVSSAPTAPVSGTDEARSATGINEAKEAAADAAAAATTAEAGAAAVNGN